jgi:hypothetical protein
MIRSSKQSEIRTADYENRVRLVSGTSISAAERLNLRAFYQGLADLSITPVEAWTFRSGQSCGTGSTAPGLYGTYAGTLVNGPTWGADGLAMSSGSNTYVSWPNSLGTLSNLSVFAIVNSTTGGFDGMGHPDGGQSYCTTLISGTMYSFLKTSTATYNRFRSGFSGVRGLFRTWSGNSFKSNVIASGGFSPDSSPEATAGTLTPHPATFYIGRDTVYGSSIDGTYTFYAVFNTAVADPAAIYSLYKTTIGQGLSLP